MLDGAANVEKHGDSVLDKSARLDVRRSVPCTTATAREMRLRTIRARHPVRPARVALAVILVFASFGVTIALIDARASTSVHRLPAPLIAIFYEITEFGKSGWLLLPLLGVLVVAITTYVWARPRFTKLLLATIVVRLVFLFAAIGAPGLCTSIVKVIVGRARPGTGAGNPFIFHPFVLRAQDMSLPSGHSTTAFAAAVAVSAMWPRVGAVAWVYALLIGTSRVVVNAHFPSDVMVSAVVGIAGSLAVRNYFADRRLVFAVSDDGKIRALPGPSFQRLKKVVGALLRTGARE